MQGLSPYVQVENLAMMILAIYKPLSHVFNFSIEHENRFSYTPF